MARYKRLEKIPDAKEGFWIMAGAFSSESEALAELYKRR